MKVVCRRTFLDVYEESDPGDASPISVNRRNSTPWNRRRLSKEDVPANIEAEYCTQLLAQANQLRDEASTITFCHASSNATMLAGVRPGTPAQPCPSQAELDEYIDEFSLYSTMESPAHFHPRSATHERQGLVYSQSARAAAPGAARGSSSMAFCSVDQESTANMPTLQPALAEGDDGETFVIHDMPRSMSLGHMEQIIGSWGLLHACDFCYVPSHYLMKQNKTVAVGYGHVHFSCKQAAAAFYEAMHGKRMPGSHTKHTISVRRRTLHSLGEAI